MSDQPYQPMTSGSLWGPPPEPVQFRAVEEVGPDRSAEFDARHPEPVDPRERVSLVEMMTRELYAVRSPKEWRRYFVARLYGAATDRDLYPTTAPKYSATLVEIPGFRPGGSTCDAREIRVSVLCLPLEPLA